MKSTDHWRSPVLLWASVILAVIVTMIIANIYAIKPENPNNKSCLQIERLNSLGANSIVVLGSSLVRHSFPYDEDLEQLAKEKDINLSFVRFTRPDTKPEDFLDILDPILKARPDRVYLQVEPFIFDFTRSPEGGNVVIKKIKQMRDNLKQLLWAISQMNLTYQPRGCIQNDSGLALQREADIQQLQQTKILEIQFKNAVLPKAYENFILKAKQRNIQVILISMGRSKEKEQRLGNSFKDNLNYHLQTLASRYQLDVWKFDLDLSIAYYLDYAHLNQKGREVFSDWFLDKLKADMDTGKVK